MRNLPKLSKVLKLLRGRKIWWIASIIFLVIGVINFYYGPISKNNLWTRMNNIDVTVRGKHINSIVVYAGSNMRIIVVVPTVDGKNPQSNCYLINRKQNIVCFAGPAFEHISGWLALTSTSLPTCSPQSAPAPVPPAFAMV